MPLLLHGQARVRVGRRGADALPGLRLTSLTPPRRGLLAGSSLAVLAGTVLAVIHPPVGFSLGAVVLPALLWAALRAAPENRAWVVGLVAGAVGHGLLLAWIVAPAGVVGWGLLSLIQGLWWALLAAVVRPWLDRPWILVVAPLAWVGVDVAKLSWPFGGFLWGDLASATVSWTWLHPVLRLGGAQLATMVVVVLSTAAWFAVDRTVEVVRRTDSAEEAMPLATEATRVGLFTLVGTAIVVSLVTVAPPPTDGVLDVLVVQGNDVEDWLGTAGDLDVAIAERMLGETRVALQDAPAPQVTLWPESSIDRDPARDAAIAAAVQEAVGLTEGNLLAGVNLDGDQPGTYLNSLAHFTTDGAILERYVKRNLVPFGEYVPFRSALDWFPPLRQVPRDGVPGPGPQVLEVDGVLIAPAICFETMEAGTVRSNLLAGDRPAGVVFSSTNDASFGRTGQPAQHLAQARLRAVETGRWVVHGAVSGRSAFVDPSGEVVASTWLFTREHLRAEIPLVTGLTPFLRTGDLVGALSVGVLAVLILARARNRRRGRASA